MVFVAVVGPCLVARGPSAAFPEEVGAAGAFLEEVRLDGEFRLAQQRELLGGHQPPLRCEQIQARVVTVISAYIQACMKNVPRVIFSIALCARGTREDTAR